MKWPEGPVGVLLGVGAAVLVSAVLWAGARALTGGSGDGAAGRGDVPAGLSATGASATVPASPGPTATLAGDGSALATGGPDAVSGSGSGATPTAVTPPSSNPTKTAFTEAQARAFMEQFLGHLRAGREAEARAMATAAFASSMGPTFFDRASDPLGVAEVLLATREGNRWNVYCGEEWESGPRQTRYGLAEKSGKLYVDSFETADLP